ncbi:Hypothetical protein CINCED_3A018668 [Cinara cedri]|uniref:Uncharacterized protein n=1 Tax=Cinara cedri TaxID=506608 RepID=A0A5E4NPL8_9HEMI|nr:Hypothetical protein CINCED_3A018668 [Cinara cedri]
MDTSGAVDLSQREANIETTGSPLRVAVRGLLAFLPLGHSVGCSRAAHVPPATEIVLSRACLRYGLNIRFVGGRVSGCVQNFTKSISGDVRSPGVDPFSAPNGDPGVGRGQCLAVGFGRAYEFRRVAAEIAGGRPTGQRLNP